MSGFIRIVRHDLNECGCLRKDRITRIIKLRFESGLELKEIGEKFGVTKQRIEQIISRHLPQGGTGVVKRDIIAKPCFLCGKDILCRDWKVAKKKFCSKKCSRDSLWINRKCCICKSQEGLSKIYNRIRKDGSNREGYICRPCNTDRIRKYRNTKNGKRVIAAITKKQRIKNKSSGKESARIALNQSVKSGKIIKPRTCSRCPSSFHIHAHHPDYSKPIDVIWLCAACHSAEHKRIRESLPLQK